MNIKPQPENAGFDVYGNLKVWVQWCMTNDQRILLLFALNLTDKKNPLSLIDNQQLFDLGFCKELTKKLYDAESGMYKLPKFTGTPLYMVSCACIIHLINCMTLNILCILFYLLSGTWKFSWQAIRKASGLIFIWCACMGDASLQACGKKTMQWKYGDWSHSMT